MERTTRVCHKYRDTIYICSNEASKSTRHARSGAPAGAASLGVLQHGYTETGIHYRLCNGRTYSKLSGNAISVVYFLMHVSSPTVHDLEKFTQSDIYDIYLCDPLTLY